MTTQPPALRLNPPSLHEPLKISLGAKISVALQTMVMDAATHKPVKINPPRKNLVLDFGLNAFAKSTSANSIAGGFSCLQIGSGTNPNSIASGSITFTQSLTTVTASGNFFTSGMVGAILKYGTGSGGTEQYITAFTDGTHVTVSSSATVSATVGTVWLVQQTALQTYLFGTNTYRTLTGDNSSTYSAGQAVLQRTFINGVQASPYTVNELGWAAQTASGNIFGRIVLSSSDVVAPTQYYLVIMELTATYTPNSPLAVGNVGTGVNTAGSLMIEWFNFTSINADGTTNQGVGTAFDLNGNILQTSYITSNYSQESSLTVTAPWPLTVGSVQGQTSTVGWVYTPGSVGVCTLTTSSTSTTTGQTCYGIALTNPGNSFQIALDVLLTNPFALPNGAFIHTTVWQMTFGRTLTN